MLLKKISMFLILALTLSYLFALGSESSKPVSISSLEKEGLTEAQFSFGGLIFEFGKSTQGDNWQRMNQKSFTDQFPDWDLLTQNGNAIIMIKDRNNADGRLLVWQYGIDGELLDFQMAAIMVSDLKGKLYLPVVNGTADYGRQQYSFRGRAVSLLIQYNNIDFTEEEAGIVRLKFYKV
jgi:hypothetical protein